MSSLAYQIMTLPISNFQIPIWFSGCEWLWGGRVCPSVRIGQGGALTSTVTHIPFATNPYPLSYSSCHLIFDFSQFLFLVPFGMALKAVGAHGVLTCSVVRSMRLFAYGLGFLFVLLLFGSPSWGSRLGSASSSRRAVAS